MKPGDVAIVHFPWEASDLLVRILRVRATTARVVTVDPGPDCFTGDWPVPLEWLKAA